MQPGQWRLATLGVNNYQGSCLPDLKREAFPPKCAVQEVILAFILGAPQYTSKSRLPIEQFVHRDTTGSSQKDQNKVHIHFHENLLPQRKTHSTPLEPIPMLVCLVLSHTYQTDVYVIALDEKKSKLDLSQSDVSFKQANVWLKSGWICFKSSVKKLDLNQDS